MITEVLQFVWLQLTNNFQVDLSILHFCME